LQCKKATPTTKKRFAA